METKTTATTCLLDVASAARLLSVSRSLLYTLVDRKRIGCYRIGRRVLFSENQLQTFLERRLVEASGGSNDS